MPFTF
ncbi:hypothetical protein VTH06DRAFT_2896 [Thermothelomyces fergusii]